MLCVFALPLTCAFLYFILLIIQVNVFCVCMCVCVSVFVFLSVCVFATFIDTDYNHACELSYIPHYNISFNETIICLFAHLRYNYIYIYFYLSLKVWNLHTVHVRFLIGLHCVLFMAHRAIPMIAFHGFNVCLYINSSVTYGSMCCIRM